MTYRIIFDDQYFRTLPSCIIDNRVKLGLGNAIGSAIQAYIDSQVALVVPGVLPYKIETVNGNLTGVFALFVHPTDGATILFQVIRPGFQEDLTNIQAEISSFIQGNDWQYDT